MGGRIVVGIDGSDGSQAALGWALVEASRRGSRLDVVLAWQAPYLGEVSGLVLVEMTEQAERHARELLSGIVDGIVAECPDVEIVPLLAEGRAAPALLDAAEGADLLVVGSRGRGGFKSLLLGSVSSACVHHAPCPVAVIPNSQA